MVDDECKLYADMKYPHRDSLDHPIMHSRAMCFVFVPVTLWFPPGGILGLYYGCKHWRNFSYQRKGHHKNWTQHYDTCLKKKRTTLSAFDE
eukprot:CAMPEP_0197020638 /NCGR_PEP_ID=MMETSP1384-20130603/1482_1 /TAXON_ID=29189 /ORGANISM="Ammonia sp." /LENGTH=90 /DNA_ID=CAMNT_0042448303 /DNA_START=300 /DNA_END=572 /DNA_ORIENTATION=+